MQKSAMEAVQSAMTVLAELKASHPVHSGTIDRVLQLLDEAVVELGAAPKVRQRRTGTGIMYRVETIGGQPVLTEDRESGKSKPFRVGEETYNAVVKVLASADRPLLLDEIAKGVGGIVRPTPPDHQMRVALRFLRHAGLLGRSKSRYERGTSMSASGKFRAAAAKAWRAASL